MRRRSEAGFSLPEVLAALALLGTLLGIATYSMSTKGSRAFSAGSLLAQELETARSRAVLKGSNVVVTVDVAASSLTIIDDLNSDGDLDTAVGETARVVRVGDFGRGVKIGFASTARNLSNVLITSAVTLPGTPPKVTFTTAGSATDGTIYLIPEEDVTADCPDRMRAVTISAATGRIKRWRYDVGSSAPAPWAPEI